MAYKRGGYYYRSQRAGQRVLTEYLGTGEFGRAVAEIDALDQELRQAELQRKRQERQRERNLDAQVDTAGNLIRLVTQAIFLTDGYHSHKGSWRKHRGSRQRNFKPG